MADIVRAGDAKRRQVTDGGCAGLSEAVAASQRNGCNRLSVRVLTMRDGGHTGMLERGSETVYLVLAGSPLLVDGDGFMGNLSEGDFAVIRPHEKHILRNESGSEARILAIMSV
jgi:mannose-6-phosphate isomerase-like protein (cupin superfamily)